MNQNWKVKRDLFINIGSKTDSRLDNQYFAHACFYFWLGRFNKESAAVSIPSMLSSESNGNIVQIECTVSKDINSRHHIRCWRNWLLMQVSFNHIRPRFFIYWITFQEFQGTAIGEKQIKIELGPKTWCVCSSAQFISTVTHYATFK